jgi:Ca2+-binding EF-hand superfamily protein
MSVMTYKQYSSFGDVVGSWDSAKKGAGEVDYLRKAFDSFDADKSGYIDEVEMRAALTMLGVTLNKEMLTEMGFEDRDGDGKLSFADIAGTDQKVDYEEFKALAALLPKREHAIYKGALQQKPIKLERNAKLSEVQKDQHKAQSESQAALNTTLKKLRTKMGLNKDSQLKDDRLLKKFQMLDQKELQKFLLDENPDLSKREAWIIMNCADQNNDKVMTFDEFKRMMQTVAKGVMES